MNERMFLDANLEEIKNGYAYENGTYNCLICGATYEEGEIYSESGRFFEARKAILFHVAKEHGSMMEVLLDMDKKFTGITENQKGLLIDFHQGLSDNEIARKNGIAAATVRHQRFMFKEKAKQAKAYLAIFELMQKSMENGGAQDFVKPHSGAKMVDERYEITNSEQEQVIKTYFDVEGTLKSFPTKEKRKIIVLRKIVTFFESGKKYSEAEVNTIIKGVYADIATIRRYLIEYGFMERTNDCREYWVKE